MTEDSKRPDAWEMFPQLSEEAVEADKRGAKIRKILSAMDDEIRAAVYADVTSIVRGKAK